MLRSCFGSGAKAYPAPDTLLCLLAGLVRQADDGECGHTALEVRLHLDGARVEADERMRDRTCEHRPKLGEKPAPVSRVLRRYAPRMDTFLTIASKRDQRDYADRDVPSDLRDRILDAGRIAGSAKNRQPWRFVVLESEDLLQRVAKTVYAPRNLLGARFVVAIVVKGSPGFDAGRAAQNMMLAAWNEGVTSCPNGMPDPEETSRLLGLGDDERVLNILSFGYPAKARDPQSRPAEEWIRRARRKPRTEVVQTV
jgi:nitroreductase